MSHLRTMKAQDYDESKVRYPCHVQTKLNGVRAYWKNDNLYSSDGCKYSPEVIAHLLPELLLLPKNVIFDGELYRHGWPLQRINSAIGVVRKSPTPDTAEIEFHVFDTIDKTGTIPFHKRHMELLPLYTEPYFKLVIPVSYVLCHSKEHADGLFKAMLEAGFEGMMYRVGSNFYAFKRSQWLLKRKKFLDAEFTVVSVYRGKETSLGSRLINTLGGVMCKTKDGKEFGVGSGFDDSERALYWNNPSMIIGKQIKVAYECLSEDGIPLKGTFLCLMP